MEIQKSKDLMKKGNTLLLYGDSGDGKTWCLGTLPEGELLLIDADGGVATFGRMKKNHDIISLVLDNDDDTFRTIIRFIKVKEPYRNQIIHYVFEKKSTLKKEKIQKLKRQKRLTSA